MPGFLGPYEGQADYHSHGYGGDKADFTEEKPDLQIQDTHLGYTFRIHIQDTYFPIVSWEAGRDLKGSWQGPKGELAET